MSSREILSIKRKALKINLDASIYGTFAEIGAGQEVARTFFQVGGASGTVAKTMSAYDMAFSDAIYGEEESGRYVSESRLQKMICHEYELIEDRLKGEKYDHCRFFSFADTCATLNYLRNNDPHCWMGLRFQTKPGGGVNEIILHIRLKENDPLLQQRTIGGMGVNLMYACYWHHENIDEFMDSLSDNINRDQAEIDMLRITGPDFHIDNRLVALMLVKKGFTSGTIFGPDKEVYQPKDLLYKKNILCLRGRFRPVTKVSEDMFTCGVSSYKKWVQDSDENLIALSEITLNNLELDHKFDDKDFLDRADILCSLGHTVLISNCIKHDHLIAYLNRCNPKSVGIVLGIMNLIELFKEENYSKDSGEILNYFGAIFAKKTRMFVYPFKAINSSKITTLHNFEVAEPYKPLFNFLKENNFLFDLENFDASILGIFSTDVIAQIKTGKEGWENSVPKIVASFIKENCLFDYPCEVKK